MSDSNSVHMKKFNSNHNDQSDHPNHSASPHNCFNYKQWSVFPKSLLNSQPN